MHLLIFQSAASPTAASIVSLVNDALIAAGKPVLGFLNPWLYSGGFKAFTDIKSGSTTGCGGSGFPAQEGWDAASGFGTPVRFVLDLPLRGLSADFDSISRDFKLRHWIMVSSSRRH